MAYYECNGCHKSLSEDNFDINKRTKKHYTRCKKCRESYNKKQKERYKKKVIPFERSFASHEKSKSWHPTKNGDVEPKDITKCNGKKYWFKCDKCPHDFEMRISSVTNGQGCTYCANQKICKDENCQ